MYGREQPSIHPPPQHDLLYVFDRNGITEQQTDMDRWLDFAVKEGTIQPAAAAVESITMQRARFNIRKRNYAWLEHHSKCTVKRGECTWEQCPGLSRDNLTDRNRSVQKSYLTHYYKFIQCNFQFEKDHYYTFAMNLVSMIPEIAMICTTKKYHGRTIDT